MLARAHSLLTKAAHVSENEYLAAPGENFLVQRELSDLIYTAHPTSLYFISLYFLVSLFIIITTIVIRIMWYFHMYYTILHTFKLI